MLMGLRGAPPLLLLLDARPGEGARPTWLGLPGLVPRFLLLATTAPLLGGGGFFLLLLLEFRWGLLLVGARLLDVRGGTPLVGFFRPFGLFDLRGRTISTLSPSSSAAVAAAERVAAIFLLFSQLASLALFVSAARTRPNRWKELYFGCPLDGQRWIANLKGRLLKK